MSCFDSIKGLFAKKLVHNNEPRVFFVDDPIQNAPHKFYDNYVKTSKYTVLTFIPKNLFEQFMRVANVYFLVISILQQIPGISPTGRWTTIGPLAFVMAVTALKEAIEDIRRHRQDNEINHRKVEVFKGSHWESIYWQDAHVGDIVRVWNRQYIPADLILLTSSEAQGICYIETASLDGETNLKVRQCLPETATYDNDDALIKLRGSTVKADQPNPQLYEFTGSIEVEGVTHPVGVKQVLLRGAMLRNTKSILGLVVYTGADSKMMKNSAKPPVKRSNVERTTNWMILFMFCLLIVMAIVDTIGFSVWQHDNKEAWYLQQDLSSGTKALAFLTFVILYNNLIPISLYVSVEFVKIGQAYFINNDIEMYHEESDTPALARTSNLNEELGQVQYIFSDKTGTLTCNKMEFRRCSIAGRSYGFMETESETESAREIRISNISGKNTPTSQSIEMQNLGTFWNDDRLERDLNSGGETAQVVREVFTLLSLCHTVIAETDVDDPTKTVYNANSPDEGALVKAAKYFGHEFVGRTPKTITIKIDGKNVVEYRIMNILEFTNDRKRMSVILQNPQGKLVMYCKGADNVIYERLDPRDNPFKDSTRKHLDEFASQGLRTLCLAKADIDSGFYNDWQKVYAEAAIAPVNREKELEKVGELIEKNLFLLGASAVEDRLQDGVPDTIATLARAGIKIWVLTGDKQETAINIGLSCRLLTSEMSLMIINKTTKSDTEEKIEEYLDQYAEFEDGSPLALVIDGDTLKHALLPDVKMKLLKLGMKCKAVICCRVSPGQKADVVRLVRENLKAITLAIGDGANDVSMIQAAHVGIGISGEEGLQAARASDYAIAQFRFLKRLLLVHGRNSYRRVSKVILYSFYKNVILYFTQFWFAFFNGYSGQTLYERWTLACYNVFFTSLPIIGYGIFDADVNDRMLDEYPQLYKLGLIGYHFNLRVFAGWIINSIFHSLLIFGVPMLTLQHGTLNPNGETVDLWSSGTIVYSAVLTVVSVKLMLEARRMNWIFLFLLGISGFMWILWILLYSLFNLLGKSSAGLGKDFLLVPYHVIDIAVPWLIVIFTMVLALGRDFSWKYIYRTYMPRSYHVVQEIQQGRSLQDLIDLQTSLPPL
eukprot:TRINITY_DN5572_c1_g1_i1.p1 TRINITY_DN5572_c1_g1~~TRINITY_DN5572_c1_g1_i1.p1  ORF type:complete len:1114 (-),score=288.91 TRINITY_DN5572_c1_g1_i1:44-3385(-)